MKKIVLLIVAVLSLNCSKKDNIQNIVFQIENIKVNSKDILKVKIINKTNENYFIILDTNRIYDYLTLNYKINPLGVIICSKIN